MSERHIEISRWETELARRWFDEVAAQLTGAERELEGGWPGTLSDARRLLFRSLGDLAITPTRSEIECSTRAIYRAAKEMWLDVATRSVSLPGAQPTAV